VFKEPLARSFELVVINLFDLPVREFIFGEELFSGVKIIDEGVKARINILEDGQGFVSLEAGIADSLPDHVAIFLFHKTVVIGMAGSPPGKSDAALIAPFFKILIDELAASVAVNAAYGDGKGIINIAGGLKRPALGLVFERPDFGPAQGYVGYGNGPGVIGGYFAPSVMGNSIYFAKTWLFLVPGPKYAYRYLVFQEGPFLGGAFSLQLMFFSFPCKQPFHGGAAYGFQFLFHLGAHTKTPVSGLWRQDFPATGGQASPRKYTERTSRA